MVSLPIFVSILLTGIQYIFRHGVGGFGIFTHLTWQERLLLYRMVRQIKERKTLVEIGSYLGASAYFLAAAASEYGTETTLFCVDTWMNDGMSEGKRNTWKEFNENTSKYSGFIFSCRGTSQEIAMNFSRSIDLLFIDGDHSLDGCRQDVESWLPYVRSGGIVLFHDYGWVEAVRQITHKLVSGSILVNGMAYGNIFWAYKA